MKLNDEVKEYLADLSATDRKALKALRKQLVEAIPGVEETLTYKIPVYRYQGKGLVSISASKNHLSLHLMSHELAKAMKNHFMGIKLSGATLQFTPETMLPLALIKKIVKARITEVNEGLKTKSKSRSKKKAQSKLSSSSNPEVAKGLGKKQKSKPSNLKRPRQLMLSFVKSALIDSNLMEAYEERPPYQRNDYLMWINAAKREDTKKKRLNQMLNELEDGSLYMKMKWSSRNRPDKTSNAKTSKKKKTKILSSGNPQVAKGFGDEPVQEYIAAMPGWKKEIGEWLDQLIVTIVPKVAKAVKWNTPLYGLPDKGYFMAMYCYKKYVQLTFFAGESLKPIPPVESKQKGVRYLNIYEDEKPSEAQMKKWIKQASKLPGEEL